METRQRGEAAAALTDGRKRVGVKNDEEKHHHLGQARAQRCRESRQKQLQTRTDRTDRKLDFANIPRVHTLISLFLWFLTEDFMKG